MQVPQSLQQILDDNLSDSASLLKRLMLALEIELLNPELDPTTFMAYIELIRKKMETFTVIRHFCDELILSHNVAVPNFPHYYLNFIKEYEEFWEKNPQQLANKQMKAADINE